MILVLLRSAILVVIHRGHGIRRRTIRHLSISNEIKSLQFESALFSSVVPIKLDDTAVSMADPTFDFGFVGTLLETF